MTIVEQWGGALGLSFPVYQQEPRAVGQAS